MERELLTKLQLDIFVTVREAQTINKRACFSIEPNDEDMGFLNSFYLMLRTGSQTKMQFRIELQR